jgi:hypothetical protein
MSLKLKLAPRLDLKQPVLPSQLPDVSNAALFETSCISEVSSPVPSCPRMAGQLLLLKHWRHLAVVLKRFLTVLKLHLSNLLVDPELACGCPCSLLPLRSLLQELLLFHIVPSCKGVQLITLSSWSARLTKLCSNTCMETASIRLTESQESALLGQLWADDCVMKIAWNAG